MTDMTTKDIEHEFRRQVYLCSGIGFERMREIVQEAIDRPDSADKYICRFCNYMGSFRDGRMCDHP